MASKIPQEDVKKGMTCLVLDPETKELEPAVVCNVPKHRRWVHAYLELTHRKLKKVPIGELFTRPENFDYEESIGQIPLFGSHVSDEDTTDAKDSLPVETQKDDNPTDEATSAIIASNVDEKIALKKGDLCLVQDGDNGYQPGVIVKVPKHGRWFHVYLELQHRRLKRVPRDEIKSRPVDYEYSTIMDIDNGELLGVQDLQDGPILASHDDPEPENVPVRKPLQISTRDSPGKSLPTLRQCVARALLVAYKLWKREILSDDEYHCFKVLTLQHDPSILGSSFAAEHTEENVTHLAAKSPRVVKAMSRLRV